MSQFDGDDPILETLSQRLYLGQNFEPGGMLGCLRNERIPVKPGHLINGILFHTMAKQMTLEIHTTTGMKAVVFPHSYLAAKDIQFQKLVRDASHHS